MLVLMARAPRPAVEVWAGRRYLAAVDAVLWPTLWIAAVALAPFQTGIAGPLAVALAGLGAVSRLLAAISDNKHYRFTTVRWGRPIAALVLVGVLLKLGLIASGQ
jgi:hypothetical protein